MIKKIQPNRTVLASSEPKENHFNFSNAKTGSSGSEFSLPSVSGSSSANPADLSPDAKERFKPEEHMKQSSSDMMEVSDGFFVFHEVYNKLYPYQREGVAWMWKLFQMKKGGVLGDDTGLGKTFQVIAFLSGLIDADMIKCALIIMPVSLLPNWEREFKKWCPGISVSLFHGASKKERGKNLLKVQREGHVLLTSYGMVLNAVDLLTEFDGRSFVWDYVILDEGHKIKNPTKTTKAVHALPSKNRLVLTGTPIQNNLQELWALYDFVHQGTLLGSLKTFKMQYENPITRAREKGSSAGEKRLGTEMGENLKMLIKPYFLRRTKAEIWSKEPDTSEGISDLDKDLDQLRISENKLTARKNDLIVWTFMSEAQCEIYRSFLHSDAVKTILVSKRSPLVELTTLKKICDHPRLLSQRACLHLGLNGNLNAEDMQRELDDESSYSSSIENVSDEALMAESGKMKFLIQLLENLKNEGHRTLVFSLSRKILDMINRILINKRWKVQRIDGTISKIDERERRIQAFQSDPSYSVFLLTTQVGGVGITLTAADRVVIYDPSWNPATDAQAVDRIYRIGQKKNVIVYRLITCGTVEEKIYRRQIFKDSITKQATTSADPYRYFSKQELRELFTFDNPHHSATQVQLSQLHSHQRLTDTDLDAHIAYLYSLDIFGVSDHDLMFSREIEDSTEDNDQAGVSHDYIKKQVAAAQMLIQTEASVVAEDIRLAGTFSRHFAEHVPVSKNSKPAAQGSKATSNSDFKPKPSVQNYSNYIQIPGPSGDEFDFKGPCTPYIAKRSVEGRSNIPKYASPLESDRDNKTSQRNSKSYDLSSNKNVPVIEINSDDEEEKSHHSLKIPPKDSSVISDVNTPLLGKRILNRCSDIPVYATPPGWVRDKKLSRNDEMEMDDNNMSVKDVSIVESDSDDDRDNQNSQISPKDSSIAIHNASTPLSGRRKSGRNLSKYLTPSGGDRENNMSYTDSFHDDERVDCDLSLKNVSVVELDSDDEERNSQSGDDFAVNDSHYDPSSPEVSFDEETLSFVLSPVPSEKRSCALLKKLLAADSDSSCPPSPSKEDFIASESEDSVDEKEESNSSSRFVPCSFLNSPAVRETTFYNRTHSSRPSKSARATALHSALHRAFVQALASSPIIQVPRDSEMDSPVKACRPAGRKRLIESSDED